MSKSCKSWLRHHRRRSKLLKSFSRRRITPDYGPPEVTSRMYVCVCVCVLTYGEWAIECMSCSINERVVDNKEECKEECVG